MGSANRLDALEALVEKRLKMDDEDRRAEMTSHPEARDTVDTVLGASCKEWLGYDIRRGTVSYRFSIVLQSQHPGGRSRKRQKAGAGV